MHVEIDKTIGPLVPAFEEEKNRDTIRPTTVTHELCEISVIHELEDLPNITIQKRNKLIIGQQEYIIEEVGTEVNKT
nr:PTS glucitol/sorbitol transporter subunit IIA [Listeria seeligeri]